ncbi:Mu transposase C-terminal domain-containing protein [Variovorax sp. LjRoot175]|uniref:Mu transposase C-terminal domain-containing protein n=1 Tax=Variovorax sp. LjRoot175 TaxID=3342276 RepID=UPI003ECC6B93
MFIQPVTGTMIAMQGQQLLFHSAPSGLVQFEAVETGELFKWTHEEFRNAVAAGEITQITTVATSTSIQVIDKPPTGHESMLIGLTEHECREQARRMFAYMTWKKSGLHLRKDAPAVKSLVSEACEAGGFKAVTTWQLIVIHQRVCRHRDVLYACTPQRKGTTTGSYRIDARDEGLLNTAIDEHYLKQEQPSIASAHRHYLRLREDDERINGPFKGLPASLRTFERRVARLDSFQRTERRQGLDEARRSHRVSRGAYIDVDPMEIGEMDDCYLPLMVVSDDFTRALGVPRLTSLRDRGTGFVPSFFLWCGDVSTFTSLATLRNLLTEKTHYLEKADLPLDAWPYTGPFGTIATDRGTNLTAEGFVRAAVAMGSAVQFLPRRTPWGKPFVERLHGYILEYIANELPGRLFDDVQSFRSYKADVKAVIPLSALIRILVHFFVNVINGVPRPGHRTTPTQEMSAWLADHPPAIPCDSRAIDLLTAMPIERSVNQEGIRWENLHYVSDELAAVVRRIGHGAKVTVFVNPGDLGEVSVVDPLTREPIRAHCTWPGYAGGISLPEHQLLCRELRRNRERIRLSALIGLQRRIQEELEAGRLGKKKSALAIKSERMQQSSQKAPAAKSAVSTVPAVNSNQGVLDAILF